MKEKAFHAVILAAGKGTRMKSERPKVLHRVCGRALLQHVLDATAKAGAASATVILGHGREEVQAELKSAPLPIFEAWQQDQKGTGHAIQVASAGFQKNQELFLIVNGDGPLLRAESLKAMVEFHREKKADLTLGVMELENPTGYGRVIGAKDRVAKIVEEKEANDKEKKIKRVNGGVYVVNRDFLERFLSKLVPSKKTGELYLTDLLGLGAKAKKKLFAYALPREELMGVNTLAELAAAGRVLQKRLAEEHMLAGVCFLDPSHTYIEAGVKIGRETVIEPNVMLFAGTQIGENVHVEAGSILKNSKIADDVTIKAYSYLEDCFVRERASVGPFARLRPEADIGVEAKVGNFVEIKKSKLGAHSKVSHLSYVGDAEIGIDVNIGCGFITCNYDGVSKHKTIVGDHAFIGSDVQAVAPIEIGADSYVASGTTVTKNVPARALAVGRARQENKEGYATRLKSRHEAQKAKK